MFGTLGWALHSNDLTIADGSLRCLDVLYSSRLFLHPNNHMLFPLHIYVFNQILGALGFQPHSAVEYFEQSTLMNTSAAAVSLAVSFLIMKRLGCRTSLGLLGVSILATSSCFFVCATNPNEPMVGFMLSVIGVLTALLSLERQSAWLALAAGAFLSYAMASYQSMICIAPAVALVYMNSPRLSKRMRCLLLSVFALGILGGIATIYGFCYYVISGIHDPSAIAQRFFQLDGTGAGTWGGFSRKGTLKWILAPIREFFWYPFHGLWNDLYRWNIADLCTNNVRLWALPASLSVGLFVTAVCGLGRLIANRSPHLKRIQLLLVFLTISVICPLWWIPNYDKLWIQPIASTVILMICICEALISSTEKSQVNLGKWFRIILFGYLTALITWNTFSLFLPQHYASEQPLQAARNIGKMSGKDDLIVVTWDKVGCIFSALYRRNNLFGIENQFIECHRNNPLLEQQLTDRINSTLAMGKNIYFIGSLDLSPQQWNDSLGDLGLSYPILENYRQTAHKLKTFKLPGNDTESVYILTPNLNVRTN